MRMYEIGVVEVALATKCTGEPEVEPLVGDETVRDAKADALNATSTQNIARRTEGVRRAIRYLRSQTTVAVRVSGDKWFATPTCSAPELLRRLRSMPQRSPEESRVAAQCRRERPSRVLSSSPG